MSDLSPSDPTRSARYLADQLSAEERREYESALQHDPQLLADLEATARLKVGLARLRETGQLEGLLKATPRWTLSRILPLAAGLAAVAIGIAVWHPASPPPPSAPWLASSPALLTSSTGGVLPVMMTVAVFHKRSGGLDAQAFLPGGHGAVELRVLPTTPVSSARYHLQLAEVRNDNGQQIIGDVEGLTPAADGFVTAYVDAAHLSFGRYKLTLSAVSSSNQELPRDHFDIEWVRDARH